MIRNSPGAWGWPARALHWVMAVGIAGQWTLGQYMTSLGNDQLQRKFDLYQLHKSIGLTLAGLALLRLLWRILTPRPELPAGMPEWERTAATVSHWSFYLLMFLLPLTGFLMAAASPLGIPTSWFGLVTIPHPIGPSKESEDLFRGMHAVLGALLALLVIVHAAAAFKHHFYDRDDVLRRMLHTRTK
jgi:cytochrome b561